MSNMYDDYDDDYYDDGDFINCFDESSIVTLKDEYGNDIQFEFLDLIEYEDDKYVVLLPLESEDDEQVIILLLEEGENDEESYTSIEDEKTLLAVFDIFKEKFKDVFSFI